jgi:hypothetical protein
MRTSRHARELPNEAMGADNAGLVPAGSGAARAASAQRTEPTRKGGISAMAKKSAKGGAKKKGGKKR